MKRVIGYARVSTLDQNLDLQTTSLQQFGCERIFTDKMTGSRLDRPGLNECLTSLRANDTLIVWRLDRLGRSMADLVSTIENLRIRNVGIKSIKDGAIDTTTASGQLIFNIFASLAHFERSLIQERTMAGLEAARARGLLGGRPRVPHSDPKVLMAKEMYKNHKIGITEICQSLTISKATFYRYVNLSIPEPKA